MAEYIEREAYCAYLKSRTAEFLDDYGKGWSNGIISARRIALKFPAADVAPVVHGHFRLIADTPTVDAVLVVRCKDCIYTRKLYGRLVCKYGTCSGCILREDFFCANGERKEGAEC